MFSRSKTFSRKFIGPSAPALEQNNESKFNLKRMGRINLLALFFFVGCGIGTVRPKLEMSLAASSFLAAQNASARSLAPSVFRKAEIYYLKAKSSYRRKYFNKAKQYALLCQKFSERAEYVAVRKKQLGDDVKDQE